LKGPGSRSPAFASTTAGATLSWRWWPIRTRRRIAELAALAQMREAELRSIHASMADAMFVCDSNGCVTFANEAAVRMTGVGSVDELKGPLQEYPKRFQIRYLDGTPIPLVKMSLSRALAGESVVLANTIIYNGRTGKDLYLRVSSSPIRDETGAVVGSVAVCTDVSELIEFDRMKDQFLRVAAHELKTPVTIMKGNAQMLLRFAEGIPSELRRGLESINRGADRITRIVDALLDVSQLHLGRIEVRRERVDLSELVDLVARRMALTTKKHQLRVVVNAANLVVPGDYSRLEQVINNLLDNAIRYSPRGGEIDVEVTLRDRKAVVSVRDHGVGIPRTKQDRIFQRFYRAHTDTPYDYGGMGVGIYISREIIARHGGEMWFESEEGTGSTFYFNLPV
jgi:PAS domain S-box-containing protein